MRDCVFMVADQNMRAAFEGFLTREHFHQSLACGAFGFDPRRDLKVASADNDPGLFIRGHELLRPYQGDYRHAVIVLDAEWDGSPGRDKIVEDLSGRLAATGWEKGSFAVVVIEPELENWIWQKNEHVAAALQFSGLAELSAAPDLVAAWPEGQAKPSSPKETLETLLRKKGIPRSSALYKRITAQVSVKRCRDAAFQQLADALRAWFPPSPAIE